MGIDGLSHFVRSCEGRAWEELPEKAVILVDGDNFVWLSTDDTLERGVQCMQHDLELLAADAQKYGRTYVFYFDGNSGEEKVEVSMRRRRQQTKRMRRIFEGKEGRVAIQLRALKLLLRHLKRLAHQSGFQVRQCWGEADMELARAARAAPDTTFVMSSDSDFFCHAVNVICLRGVLVNGLPRWYPRDFLRTHFAIDDHLLPGLAVLVGNDYTSSSPVRSLINRINDRLLPGVERGMTTKATKLASKMEGASTERAQHTWFWTVARYLKWMEDHRWPEFHFGSTDAADASLEMILEDTDDAWTMGDYEVWRDKGHPVLEALNVDHNKLLHTDDVALVCGAIALYEKWHADIGDATSPPAPAPHTATDAPSDATEDRHIDPKIRAIGLSRMRRACRPFVLTAPPADALSDIPDAFRAAYAAGEVDCDFSQIFAAEPEWWSDPGLCMSYQSVRRRIYGLVRPRAGACTTFTVQEYRSNSSSRDYCGGDANKVHSIDQGAWVPKHIPGWTPSNGSALEWAWADPAPPLASRMHLALGILCLPLGCARDCLVSDVVSTYESGENTLALKSFYVAVVLAVIWKSDVGEGASPEQYVRNIVRGFYMQGPSTPRSVVGTGSFCSDGSDDSDDASVDTRHGMPAGPEADTTTTSKSHLRWEPTVVGCLTHVLYALDCANIPVAMKPDNRCSAHHLLFDVEAFADDGLLTPACDEDEIQQILAHARILAGVTLRIRDAQGCVRVPVKCLFAHPSAEVYTGEDISSLFICPSWSLSMDAAVDTPRGTCVKSECAWGLLHIDRAWRGFDKIKEMVQRAQAGIDAEPLGED